MVRSSRIDPELTDSGIRKVRHDVPDANPERGKALQLPPRQLVALIGANERMRTATRPSGGCVQRPPVTRSNNHYAEKLDPHPQELVALGLLNTNPRPMISSLKSMVVPLRYR